MDKLQKLPVHPAEQIVTIICRIYQRGMTTTSGGNVSVMDAQGDLWITPATVDKGTLTPADIVCLKQDGTIVGRHKPSSEYPFHKAVYAIRPDIKAIIHAHPPALVSFSIIRKCPETKAFFKAWDICGSVGYSGYELTGSEKLGQNIAAEFSKGFNAVMMENHGAVVGASDADTCYMRFETFEFCARSLLNAHLIGTPQFPSVDLIRDYNRLNSLLPEKTILPDPSITEQRNEICMMVARSCKQGLMAGAFGTVSVRAGEHDFLITPDSILRWNLVAEDLVMIQNGCREAGKIPDKSASLHQAIYKANPAINAIIQTCSPNIMAFAIAHAWLDVRTIPEAWIYLQDIPSVDLQKRLTGESEIAGMFSEKKPAVLVENDSLLVTGDKLLQAFDRLEVAEFSAMSLILARHAGDFKPITDSQIDELKKTFNKDGN